MRSRRFLMGPTRFELATLGLLLHRNKHDLFLRSFNACVKRPMLYQAELQARAKRKPLRTDASGFNPQASLTPNFFPIRHKCNIICEQFYIKRLDRELRTEALHTSIIRTRVSADQQPYVFPQALFAKRKRALTGHYAGPICTNLSDWFYTIEAFANKSTKMLYSFQYLRTNNLNT